MSKNHQIYIDKDSTYEGAQGLHEIHPLLGSLALTPHNNFDWSYQHLTAPQLEAQLNHDSNSVAPWNTGKSFFEQGVDFVNLYHKHISGHRQGSPKF